MKGGFSRKRKLGKALSGGLLGQLLGEAGNTISDADRARLQTMAGQDSGKSISDADMARLQEFLGSMTSPRRKTDRQLMQFEKGGKVKKPKKYKGPLPKPKPTKVERLLNKRIKGEKGPYIPKIGDLNEMGPMIIDTKTGKKVKRLNKGGGLNAAINRVKKAQGMEDGGGVPKKFKGFSKLPEDVQQQMNPTLAAKYEDGGAVRGMGRAYMGAPRKVKIR